MIPINQAELNTVVATCSRNKQLTGTVYYLWTITHKLTKQNWKFIPYLLALLTAASTIAENNLRLNGKAAPPPRRVTLGEKDKKVSSGDLVNIVLIK